MALPGAFWTKHTSFLPGALLATSLLGLACSAEVNDAGNLPTGGVGGNGTGAAGPGGGAAGVSTAGTGGQVITGENCTPAPLLPQRIVRLDFNKVAKSIQHVLGPTSLMGVTLPGSTGNVRRREFQALMEEGDLINNQVLVDTVNMTEGAIKNLGTPAALAALTGCAAPATDACATGALTGALAEKAFRRPATDAEKADITDLYNTLKTAMWSVDDATRYVIEALLIAPQAVYRSELGTVAGAQTTLTPYEVASDLSYFLTDAPPDQQLYDAAKAGALGTPEQLKAHIDRLILSDVGKENLNQLVVAYYEIGNIDSVTKDPSVVQFSEGLANSMYTETDLFIRNTLWQGKLNDLLTSRTSYVNETLATFYGIQYPGTAGSNMFVPFQFPEGQRGGLLTQPSILTVRARTNSTSVVSRGLYVNGKVLCQQTPPSPPESVQSQVEAQLMDATATERQKADFRAMTSPCMSCHAGFDAYGLVLETYDLIGRYRTTYPGNVAIDTSTTLPSGVSGGLPSSTINNVIELENAVTSNDTFSRCISSNFLKYAQAQAQPTVKVDDCQVKKVHDDFKAADQSFTSMIRAVALFDSSSPRAVGGP